MEESKYKFVSDLHFGHAIRPVTFEELLRNNKRWYRR